MSPRARALLRAAAATGAAGLLAFHAALLAQRLRSPGALDAASGARWLASLALLLACAGLRRRASGLDLRRASALGLAVLLLHAPAVQGPLEQARAAELLAALPQVALPGLALAALAALAGGAQGRPACARAGAPLERARAPRSPWLAVVAPRPPPSASC